MMGSSELNACKIKKKTKQPHDGAKSEISTQ